MAKKEDDSTSDFVKLSGSIGGILIAMTVIFLIFAENSLDLFVPIAIGFLLFGIFVAFFQYKSLKQKRK